MTNFQFIPVLDLKDDKTVYAVKGDRQTYQPIKTPLAEGHDPLDIAKTLICETDAHSLYIADLNALEGSRKDNQSTINAINAALPAIDLLIDTGIRSLQESKHKIENSSATFIVASETLRNPNELASLTPDARNQLILSLDFDQAGFKGHEDLFKNTALWPDRIILMTLNKVGSNEGPDLERLQWLKNKAPDKHIFAAGGVRSIDDAEQLANAGVAGVLLATALHNGAITQKEIAAFRRKRRSNA